MALRAAVVLTILACLTSPGRAQEPGSASAGSAKPHSTSLESAPPESASPESATPAPNLNGVWNLDEHGSDNLEAFTSRIGKLLASARASRQRAGAEVGGGDDMPGGRGDFDNDDQMGGGGMSRGGMGRGAMAGGGRGRPGGGRHGAAQGARSGDDARPGQHLETAIRQLLISGTSGTIEIMDGNDRSYTYITDGQLHANAGGPHGNEPRPGAHVTRATWQDGTLVVEQAGGPLTIVRRLRLAPDGTRLLVEISVEGAGNETVTAHLEYAGVP